MRVQDRTVRLWNPKKGTAIKVYKGESLHTASRLLAEVSRQSTSPSKVHNSCAGHGYDVRDVAVARDNSK